MPYFKHSDDTYFRLTSQVVILKEHDGDFTAMVKTGKDGVAYLLSVLF